MDGVCWVWVRYGVSNIILPWIGQSSSSSASAWPGGAAQQRLGSRWFIGIFVCPPIVFAHFSDGVANSGRPSPKNPGTGGLMGNNSSDPHPQNPRTDRQTDRDAMHFIQRPDRQEADPVDLTSVMEVVVVVVIYWCCSVYWQRGRNCNSHNSQTTR